MNAPSLERLETCDLEELEFLRGWVESQRAGAVDLEVRARLLERIEQAMARFVRV